MGKPAKKKDAEKFLVIKMDINIMINYIYLSYRIYSYRVSLALETKNKNNH